MPNCQAKIRHCLYNIFMITIDIIRERLSEAINESDLSHRQIAEKINIKPATLYNIFRAGLCPRLTLLLTCVLFLI